MSILILLPIDNQRVSYVLSCKDKQEQWIVLLKWLSSKNITFCSLEEYKNPDKLKPLNLYCIKSETIYSAFKLFQVNVTNDWEDKETPAPQFVSDVGYLSWVDIIDDSIASGDSSLVLEEKLRQSMTM